MRRVYYDMPSIIAECGGPCAAGPEHCDCGALWRDEPVRLDPGNVQRGNGSGGPTTPKPQIVPKPQLPSPLLRPAQPLAADLIRYQRWQQQQIERALRDEPPTPN